MEDQVRLNVLWVDDIPTEEFMNEAFEEGLEITSVTCVNSGIDALKNKSKSWDAIILDANCKITDDEQEQPSLEALQHAIYSFVDMRTEIPWFVYTGGDYAGVEHLKLLIKKRDYDDRSYYEKPQQRYELFENIKNVVANSKVFAIKQKYAPVCSFYKDYDLIELLLKLENEDLLTDTSIPNRIRQILEWIMRYFETKGLLPIPFTGTNIANCSRNICELRQLVPIHVVRSLHFCVEVCNDGSHDREVAAYLVSGDAPYLNKSLILNLLNILQWCPSLQRFEKEVLVEKVTSYIQQNKEEKEKRKNSAK